MYEQNDECTEPGTLHGNDHGATSRGDCAPFQNTAMVTVSVFSGADTPLPTSGVSETFTQVGGAPKCIRYNAYQ